MTIGEIMIQISSTCCVNIGDLCMLKRAKSGFSSIVGEVAEALLLRHLIYCAASLMCRHGPKEHAAAPLVDSNDTHLRVFGR